MIDEDFYEFEGYWLDGKLNGPGQLRLITDGVT